MAAMTNENYHKPISQTNPDSYSLEGETGDPICDLIQQLQRVNITDPKNKTNETTMTDAYGRLIYF
jgi:hypothetical protein